MRCFISKQFPEGILQQKKKTLTEELMIHPGLEPSSALRRIPTNMRAAPQGHGSPCPILAHCVSVVRIFRGAQLPSCQISTFCYFILFLKMILEPSSA
jgi:hypothetical protein